MRDVGQTRLYQTLCKVLDSLRAEAPKNNKTYHPPAGNNDALIQARSRALLHLFLKARFGLVHFDDREALVTDGPHDGGIDAYYIDQKHKFIYVLQSKFRATAGNFTATNMSASDLLKMDVGPILKGVKRDEQGISYNDRITKGLQKAVQRLPDVGSYITQVVLLGNTKNFTALEIKKLVLGYKVEQFPHERTYEDLLFPVINGTYFSDPNLTIEINLANLRGESHLAYEVKANSVRSNIKILFVPTREIGRIMYVYKNSVLKYNPRSFLELQNNLVNQDIEASIKNEKNNEFALFNNGITIISDQTSISSDTAKQDTAQIVLRNPQLVNGGQTAFTLGRIYEESTKKNDYSVFKGKEVLLRVITFIGPANQSNLAPRLQLLGEISKASNSQTKIEEADRRSNDPIQIKLQKQFFDKYGLYYERKRGEFSDGMHSGYIAEDMLVNREKLIRVCLAGDYRINQARSSITKFFSEGQLSSLFVLKDTAKYAYGYEVLRIIDMKRKTKPAVKGDRYHTKDFGQALRYGQYALLAVCINEGIKARKTESEIFATVLSKWKGFEAWIQKRNSNKSYRLDASFDFANYYKGATINDDLQKYSFSV
jgi:hypothetical protein